MTKEHQPIVFGPVGEGELDISGNPYVMPGYGWSCSCGQSGIGYLTEREAEDWCEHHMGRSAGPAP